MKSLLERNVFNNLKVSQYEDIPVVKDMNVPNAINQMPVVFHKIMQSQ